MRKLLLSVFALCSLGAVAQEDEWDMLEMGRIEHVESYVTDATGTHKVPRKSATANTKFLSVQSPRVPVILVDFPDRKFYASGKTTEEVRSNFDLFFNGYDDSLVKQKTGSYGSAFSYFDDMSLGRFTPTFDILGPYELEKGYAYYGQDSGSSRDIHFNDFCKEAATMAVNDHVDWSVFDNDGDGKVDIVFFIYAGWGEHSAAVRKVDPDAIWPKESSASMSVTDSLGKKVTFGMYGVSCEARAKSTSQVTTDAESGDFPNGYNPENIKMDGVGTCLHELSHALGLPDFYDINYKGFGMDYWSLMDNGEHVNSDYCPVAYTAYERNFLGWEPLDELTEPQVLTLKCFADGGVGYKIVNDAYPNEYYVIENRQGKGWDTFLGTKIGHGMQVTYVDYDASRWASNSVNTNAAHQRMTIIAANNNYDGANVATSSAQYKECMQGQLYPGATFNYNLTDDSTPAAALYYPNVNGSYLMSKPLRNITENADGTVTVCFCTNGKLATPVVPEAPENVGVDSFTATWEAVENATRYVVEVEVEDHAAMCDTLSADSLVEMSRVYTDLPSANAVKYRVMAMANCPEDYISSDWSEYVSFYTDVDAVSEVRHGEQYVEVYAMNGMPVSHCKLSDLHRLFVRPGVYVVKYQNGLTRKTVIK